MRQKCVLTALPFYLHEYIPELSDSSKKMNGMFINAALGIMGVWMGGVQGRLGGHQVHGEVRGWGR